MALLRRTFRVSRGRRMAINSYYIVFSCKGERFFFKVNYKTKDKWKLTEQWGSFYYTKFLESLVETEMECFGPGRTRFRKSASPPKVVLSNRSIRSDRNLSSRFHKLLLPVPLFKKKPKVPLNRILIGTLRSN